MVKPDSLDLAIKRAICGEKTILKSIGDGEFWIIPKKFSVSGVDELTQLQIRASRGLKSDVLRKAAAKLKEKGLEVTQANLLENLTPEEMAETLSAVPDDARRRGPMVRISILYGIARHNLRGEESEKVTEELVDIILQSNALATEIHSIIDGYNDFFSQAQPGPK